MKVDTALSFRVLAVPGESSFLRLGSISLAPALKLLRGSFLSPGALEGTFPRAPLRLISHSSFRGPNGVVVSSHPQVLSILFSHALSIFSL